MQLVIENALINKMLKTTLKNLVRLMLVQMSPNADISQILNIYSAPSICQCSAAASDQVIDQEVAFSWNKDKSLQ